MSSNQVITRARTLVAEFYETALAEATPDQARLLINAHLYIRQERWYLLASSELANGLYTEVIGQLGDRDFLINGVTYLKLLGGFNDSEYNTLFGTISSSLSWVRGLSESDPEVAERGFRLETEQLKSKLPWFAFVYLWSTLPVPEVEGIERPNRTQ